MARLYGDEEEINQKKVKKFFDERANKDVDNLLSITMYHEKEIVEKRHLEESEIVLNQLDLKDKKILEIGCGIGRWAEVFHDKCKEFLGIDYSGNLIKIAKENYIYENCFFQEMSATEIKEEELLIKPPFDIIFITGVLIYLNDEDIKLMIEEINKITGDNKVIYIRETVSNLDTRLTLKDFYSDDLQEDYNAIYRTEKELLNFFKDLKNITEIESETIYKDLNERKETSYQFFILK